MVASMISRSSGLSLYRQVADAIRQQIISGELPPGSLLPSEKYLAEEHDVGRDTIRDAMAHLRSEGLVESKRGYRSRVRALQPRERIWLHPGEVVTARMPTPAEKKEHSMQEGVPVLVVGDKAYPADRYEVGPEE
jgi:DNA-binding FadR family transcriptional regulator